MIRKDAEPFKIVYLAPLKALATEVTTKFTRALSGLGVKVKELTGAQARVLDHGED